MEKIKKFNWLIIILLICIIKIYFTSVQDINTRTLAEYDDALMIKQANAILEGKWLGEYNCLTLVKGPFVPLTIAFFNIIHIPF